MDGWLHSVVSEVRYWRFERRIVRQIYPALWQNVRRKIAIASESELTSYAKVRAAQLSQERIDSLMKANPKISGTFASRLLVKCTDRATGLVLAAIASTRRSAA